MKNLLDNLVRFGIMASLSDRDEFIDKVSVHLEKYDLDPVKAQKLATAAALYLESVKDNMNMRHQMRHVLEEHEGPDKKDVEELNALLIQVTKELKELKAQKNNV